jgi:hypothetical protein
MLLNVMGSIGEHIKVNVRIADALDQAAVVEEKGEEPGQEQP